MVTKIDDWHCKSQTHCPNGDCPGCKDGKRWCKDPRCAPYCANCNIHKDRDKISNMIMFSIFVGMLLIFILVTLFILYPDRYVYVPNRLSVDPPYGTQNRSQLLNY